MWVQWIDLLFEPGYDLAASLIQIALALLGALFMAGAIICAIGDAQKAAAERRERGAMTGGTISGGAMDGGATIGCAMMDVAMKDSALTDVAISGVAVGSGAMFGISEIASTAMYQDDDDEPARKGRTPSRRARGGQIHLAASRTTRASFTRPAHAASA